MLASYPLCAQAVVSRANTSQSFAGLWPRVAATGTYLSRVTAYRFTPYFENEVLRKRPYLRKEWCIRALEQPIRIERQDMNRWRFWAAVPELEGRILRVVTLDDRVTIHNAFPDRGFKP